MERLFIRWVRNPNDPHVRKFWVDWVQDNPQQAETVESAKVLVDTVSDWEETEMLADESRSLWQRIRESLIKLPEAEKPASGFTHRVGSWPFLKWTMGIGATVVVLLFLFMRDTPPFPDHAESQNALGTTFGEGSLIKADSTENRIYPDSSKNRVLLK